MPLMAAHVDPHAAKASTHVTELSNCILVPQGQSFCLFASVRAEKRDLDPVLPRSKRHMPSPMFPGREQQEVDILGY